MERSRRTVIQINVHAHRAIRASVCHPPPAPTASTSPNILLAPARAVKSSKATPASHHHQTHAPTASTSPSTRPVPVRQDKSNRELLALLHLHHPHLSPPAPSPSIKIPSRQAAAPRCIGIQLTQTISTSTASGMSAHRVQQGLAPAPVPTTPAPSRTAAALPPAPRSCM